MLADLEFDMLFPGHGLWSLADGRRHVREAMSFVNRLLLPPNL
jgi:hydroxyacylglutathione hydrolase